MDGRPAGELGESAPLTFDYLVKRLHAQSRRKLAIGGFSEAAVLVPVIQRGKHVCLGYTLRPDDMPTHPGQISFPGGRHDPGDKDLTATALREINEELGVAVKDIEVIGKIDDVPTPVGFVITPVVGWLRNPAVFSIDEREVAEYFEVDVKELSSPGNFKHRGQRQIAGVSYPVPEFHVDGRLIWGATARITRNLLEVTDLV